ncbi:MAG: UDP-N-acetylmuramate--L-alanine ligase [Candidatus Paceibacterota bacterium]|jgi:UDP-N-acetylmuramate--alanine ligase
MNFKDIKKVYFIGIGGIGISALAQLMHHEGKMVSGTNDNPSPDTLDRVRALGIEINIGADISKIPADTDLIVYSLAWDDREPEFMKAVRSLNIPVFSYPQALGLVSVDKYTIAISGTHGKTTTTAMIAEMMIEAKLDPTVVVGSLLKSGSNFVAGESNYFVVEACEYRRSFLNLNPNIAIITNIDNDHLDYYKDIADIQNAFAEFAGKLPADGFLICDMEDHLLIPAIEAAKKIGARVVDYKKMPEILDLLVPGAHNIKDAQCSLAVAEILKIDLEEAKNSLKKFSGTWRRFEYKGETKNGALVYDDYAHHPTEIRASILGAREFMKKRDLTGKLIVVFQPHLYSRTKLLKDDFAEALALADQVILLPVYAAREQVDLEISSDILASLIREKGGAVDSVLTPQEASKMALEQTGKGDLLITMGAGDISQLAPNLL